ncbi:MAG: DUF1648 domain-containing protein [Paenisporosarcina sp.]
MAALIFIMTLLFIITIQAFLPRFLKESEAFGVYVPDTHVRDARIEHLKVRYTQTVLTSGVVLFLLFIGWLWMTHPSENQIGLFGMAVQIVAVTISMVLYAKNHLTLMRWKKEEQWIVGQVERKVVDLQFREQLKLLPNLYFFLPMLITLGLGAYGLSQYDSLPNQIPTHWGPNGEADAFTEKSWVSVSSLPLMTLLLQGMMLFFNSSLKQSGAKIRVRHKKRSREQQLAFRKYTSWLLFVITISMTVFMSYLQLTIIAPTTMSTGVTLSFTIGFLLVILGSVLYYTVKVGQSGTMIPVELDSQDGSNTAYIDVDDDRYWKLGLFYFNKDDPSIMVEKRFGVGWTINIGHMKSWILLVVLIGSIILIANLQS